MLFRDNVIQIGNTPMKRCPTSVAIKDMQGQVHRNWHTDAGNASEMYPAHCGILKKIKEEPER